MKKILIFLLLSLSFFSQAQTGLSWTPISFSDPDLNRAGGGAEQWTAGQNIVNIPVEGTNTQRLSVYYRFQWGDIQLTNSAGPGQCDFKLFDAQVNDAINRRQTFGFGIMPNCCSGPSVGGAGLVYPLALHNAMQAESPTDWNNSGGWYENPNSPSWLTWFRALHQAINTHIQNTTFMGVRYRDVIKRVDVRILGDFGEQAVLNGGPTPTSTALKNLVDAVVDSYPNIYCTAMVGAFGANTGVGITPQDVGLYELQKTNNAGPLGWRWDSWGWTDGYMHSWLENNPNVVGGYHFDTAIMNRYKYAPVGGEPADLGAAGNFNDLPVRVDQYHAESFGNGNLDVNNPPNATIKNNFRLASKKAGYRILPLTSGSSMTTSPQTGSTYNITINWQNFNGIPAYNNWKVVYEWRDGNTLLQRDTSNFNLKGFFTTFSHSQNFSLVTVPAGVHDLYMKVVDPTGYMAPMPLYVTGRLADGSYLVRAGITVTAGTGVGTANAGPSRTYTITPPATTVTGSLDGTLSSGTVTSYTWSQDPGGPNTGNILSPSTVTTSVTGLIAGTYVFRLTVNGGSTDTMRITVNPPVPPSPSTATIFTTQFPNTGTQSDGQPLELGVKFRSSTAGYITGIRFYKTSGNTGVHVGQLYNSAGTLLASANFVSESNTGWQTVQLATPVPILANTTYVAAYFSPNGFYTETGNYFGAAVVNTPLTALADGTDGHNAVYKYTATPAFPNVYTSLNNKPNYWVDVVFSLTNPGSQPVNRGRSIWFQHVGP